MNLTLREVTKAYGKTDAVHDVSFDLSEGKCIAILGESGAGKSTLLRLILGLEKADSGEILYAENQDEIAMIFQDAALLEHCTIFDNIAYGLHGRYKKQELSMMVEEIAIQLHIQDQLKKYPCALSAGEKQRASIARALIRKPKLLLLDEPTASLDYRLKDEIDSVFRSIKKEGMTMLLATHDQKEARILGDTIGIMHAGKILEWGDFYSLYNHPSTIFTARFLGEKPMNIMHGEVKDQVLYVMNGSVSLKEKRKNGKVTVGFRAEAAKEGNRFCLPVRFTDSFDTVCLYEDIPVHFNLSTLEDSLSFDLSEEEITFFEDTENT